MKRYIRASFDSSMPDWLKRKFNQKYRSYGNAFVKKYGIALSDVEFLDSPTVKSIPIYSIGGTAYIPGVNDEEEVVVNNRWRKLGKIAKSTLESLADDIVYVDIADAPKVPNDRNYKDPRYIYDRWGGRNGSYGGQYLTHNGTWSHGGNRGASEVRSRDKSGYVIPDPKEQLVRYYDMFPEKITNKVESIYQRILDVKDKVLNPDIINTPKDRNENMSIGNAIYRLKDAIEEYRDLLREMQSMDKALSDTNKYDKKILIESVSSSIKRISDSLDEAERDLTNRW